MTPEVAAVLLELCTIIEGWPGAPAQVRMGVLKEALARKVSRPNWKCDRCDWVNEGERTHCLMCRVLRGTQR